MSIQPIGTTAWPAQVALDHPHDREVRAEDGACFELEAFRDACRGRAEGLRERAMAQASSGIALACRRGRDAVARRLRTALLRRAGAVTRAA